MKLRNHHFGRALLVLGAVALSFGTSCGKGASSAKPPAPPDPRLKVDWSPDEMASNPEGYLIWARAKLDEQRKTRDDRVALIAVRRKDVEERREKFAKNVEGCDRTVKLMQTAIRRAEDEDRWPIQMGGRSFERPKADAIIVECNRLVAERSPYLSMYDETLAKLDQAAGTLRKELADLKTLRERIDLDLERVRLSQGVAELAQLKRTEAEIAYYSKIVAAVVEETSGAAASGPVVPQPVDLEALLK